MKKESAWAATILAMGIAFSAAVAFHGKTILAGSEVKSVRTQDNADATPVSIDVSHFPDDQFRAFISENLDTDKDGTLSSDEITNTIVIDCSFHEIKDMSGIGYFTYLQKLDCRFNLFTTLDISQNKDLEILECGYNDLASLSISSNTALKELDCRYCKLTCLDVSSNVNLEKLLCYVNPLSSLDVSKNVNLVELDCSECGLASLDVTANRKLQVLVTRENKLSSLNLTQNMELIELWCTGNLLTSLRVDENINLHVLVCDSNKIKDLYLVNQKQLTWLNCSNNEIESLDLTYNTKLQTLECSDNVLFTLDLSCNPELLVLECGYNFLSKVDVSSNTKLQELDCEFLFLSSLDVTKNADLKALYCATNCLTALDLSHNPNLETLCCPSNYLNELDLSHNPKLEILSCHLNYLSELRIDACPVLCELISKVPPQYLTEPQNGKEYVRYEYSSDNPFLHQLFEYDRLVTLIKEPPANQGTFEDFVERLYTVALGRASEAEGKAFWVDQVVNKGLTGADCARFFLLEAPEFMNRNLPDDQFVETLYQTFFGRASEADGKAYWLGRLASGSPKADLVNDFIESVEWCNICAAYGVKSGAIYHKATIASENARRFANRLYVFCLGREAEADGLAYWSLALTNLDATGFQAAQLFFESEEFMGLQVSNAEFMTRLYTTFMGRAPEVDGYEYWLKQLAAGTSRRDVLRAFAACPEFQKICNRYGIERGDI